MTTVCITLHGFQQLFNVVESNRCRGVYIAASQISKTIVGERANTIYFRMDSQKSVLVALQEIANVTVALICDAEFLNEEDAKVDLFAIYRFWYQVIPHSLYRRCSAMVYWS
jgi:hypothetical protein